MKWIIAALILISPFGQTASTTILFGSCSHQDSDMTILDSIISDNPDLFVFLGDNIYGDTEDMSVLKAKYDKLGSNPRFRKLREKTDVIATWDDHDYGKNDAGAEYHQKVESKRIMLDFWQEPQSSPRYTEHKGVYTSHYVGEGDNLVQIILLDLRFNRDPIKQVSKWSYVTNRKFKNMGPYSPSEDPNATMLGQEQWKWFEAQLKKPSKIKVIASSLQLLPEFTGWEAWANFPADRRRLLNFIDQQKINGVMIMSGDTHWGEISMLGEEVPYPLWEVTSSGLTEEWKDVSPNKHRFGGYTHDVNYGFLHIDWQSSDPNISFGLKNIDGEIVNQTNITLSSISPF